jgi:hypothetical protein
MTEKPSIYNEENISTLSTTSPPLHDAEKTVVFDDAVGANTEVNEDSLPPGYFTSKFFVGTMAGIGLGLMAGVAAYGYAAPILGTINADIGPVRLSLSGIASGFSLQDEKNETAHSRC